MTQRRRRQMLFYYNRFFERNYFRTPCPALTCLLFKICLKKKENRDPHSEPVPRFVPQLYLNETSLLRKCVRTAFTRARFEIHSHHSAKDYQIITRPGNDLITTLFSCVEHFTSATTNYVFIRCAMNGVFDSIHASVIVACVRDTMYCYKAIEKALL